MNEQNSRLATEFVPSTYIQQGLDAIRARENLFTTLLSQRRIPDDAWDELTIEMVLHHLAGMDSNNFRGNIGAGEREARVFSSLVAKRHYYLCHGVGRSGDVAAIQPKAGGSSLIVQLVNALAKDILKECGMRTISAAIILPVATGMSLAMTFLTLKQQKPSAKYVIWPRIDQKSCLKGILCAGLIPLVLSNTVDLDGQLCTDIERMRKLLSSHESADILGVLTTTSCFAPRGCDQLVKVAQLCSEFNVAHVVNNAYGVQSSKCMHAINEAMRCGRVDAVIQSLDKNFMMPVGGAIVSSGTEEIVANISKMYPGRASNTPVVDFFITMLHMGRTGYLHLRKTRKELAGYMKKELEQVAHDIGERIINCSQNEISFAMTLGSFFSTTIDKGVRAKALTFLGSMLFSRGVSGVRVVSCLDAKTIGGITFQAYGAHHNEYPIPYLTVACAIGITRDEIDALMKKLRKTIDEWCKQHSKLIQLE